jgi:hypothetical protein
MVGAVWCVMYLQAVLQYHPGLEFLADTPEFQARYAETVIYRIFYTINRCAWAQFSCCLCTVATSCAYTCSTALVHAAAAAGLAARRLQRLVSLKLIIMHVQDRPAWS